MERQQVLFETKGEASHFEYLFQLPRVLIFFVFFFIVQFNSKMWKELDVIDKHQLVVVFLAWSLDSNRLIIRI